MGERNIRTRYCLQAVFNIVLCVLNVLDNDACLHNEVINNV